MKHGRPIKHACHCCGAPQLQESELRVLVALQAAKTAVTQYELVRVCELNLRTVRRVLSTNSELFIVRRFGSKTPALVELSPLGVIAAGWVTGSQLAEAAE